MKCRREKEKECRLNFPFPFPCKCLQSRLIYEQINWGKTDILFYVEASFVDYDISFISLIIF